jgi:hypothetical protein
MRPVKQTDIASAQHNTKILNAITTQANSVTANADALDQGPGQTAYISQMLSTDEFKLGAGIAGAHIELPTQWLSNILKSGNQAGATQKSIDYVTSVLQLRETAMGLTKLITGGSRASEQQVNALQATLPGFENNSGIVDTKLAKLGQDVKNLGQSTPLMKSTPRVAFNPAPQRAQASQQQSTVPGALPIVP